MWRFFAKSVLFGSAAAAAIPSVFTVCLALGWLGMGSVGDGHGDGMLWLLYVVLLPISLTIPIVLVARVVFGLPLATYLRRTEREDAPTYTIIGGAIGLLLPICVMSILGAPEGYWVSVFGMVGGTVTAYTWSRSIPRRVQSNHRQVSTDT